MAQPALLTAREIAQLLELRDAQQVLDLRRHRLGFPQPVGRRRRALVWVRSEIEEWAATAAGATPNTPLGASRSAPMNAGDHLPVTEPSSSRDTAETLRP